MIDCTTVTDFHRNNGELQEFFLFAYAVAGKPSKVTQAKVNYLLEIIYENRQVDAHTERPGFGCYLTSMGPLEYLVHQARLDWDRVHGWLKAPLPQRICDLYWIKESKGGLGKYQTWSEMLDWIAKGCTPIFGGLDLMLRKATLLDLEEIPGVKYKTSRFFVLHSRNDEAQKCIPLDTHILRFLRHRGHDEAPNKTPGGEHVYKYWESVAISEFQQMNLELDRDWGLAQWDLETWKEFSGNLTDPRDKEKPASVK
tara:strand:+ start:908 stop:1672 length:765 start_codon:yes stop_codon:yes gene_type:complete